METIRLGGPEDMCLRYAATFRKHSTIEGCFVGTMNGKAYALHECEQQDGTPALVLFLNREASALIEDAQR